MNKWDPWNLFNQNAEARIFEITAPPCATCNNFIPMRQYSTNGDFEGIRICHAIEMEKDFSCYYPKPTPQNEEENKRAK